MAVQAMVAVGSLVLAGSVDAGTLAIRGGTLIDVSHYGTMSNDIPDATVIITDGKITAAGPSVSIKIPANAKRIDARGRYLVPGLIDGFGARRDPGFANAFLYEGVCPFVPFGALSCDIFLSWRSVINRLSIGTATFGTIG